MGLTFECKRDWLIIREERSKALGWFFSPWGIPPETLVLYVTSCLNAYVFIVDVVYILRSIDYMLCADGLINWQKCFNCIIDITTNSPALLVVIWFSTLEALLQKVHLRPIIFQQNVTFEQNKKIFFWPDNRRGLTLWP